MNHTKVKTTYAVQGNYASTYNQFYQRCEICKQQGFHLGDLSWDDWQTYLYGTPQGGGQYIQNYIIGHVPDNEWIIYEKPNDEYDY